MLTRRFFTQALASTFAWLAGGKVTKAADVVIEASQPVGVYVPPWCPKGWLPAMGQEITAEQYPDMFVQNVPLRPGSARQFRPVFFGKQRAHLECFTPVERPLLKQMGWQDNLEHNLRPLPDNKLAVQIMAVEHQRHANGRIWHAGFTSRLVIDKDEFEKDYGPVLPSQTDGLCSTVYEYPGGYPGGLVSDEVRADMCRSAEHANKAEQAAWRAGSGTPSVSYLHPNEMAELGLVEEYTLAHARREAARKQREREQGPDNTPRKDVNRAKRID